MATLHVVAHDTTAELRQKLRTAHDATFKNRVKAILLALEGKKRYEIVAQLKVDSSRVTAWVHCYNQGGVEALIFSKGGRPEGNPKWNSAPFNALAKEIDNGGYWSIPRMQEWLKEHHNLTIPEQTIWYRMDRLNYSYKSARPHPVKGDRERQETFKKGASLRTWKRG
jgi:transposase